MWNVGDWIGGVEEITPETEYVYFRLVMFIYQMDGTLKDSDQANARRCRVSTRAYRKHKSKLIDLGKIEVRDGLIWNARCEHEINHVKEISTRAKTRSEKRWKAHLKSKLAEKPTENSLVLEGKTRRKLALKTRENPENANDFNKTMHASSHATQHATQHANQGTSEVEYREEVRGPPLTPLGDVEKMVEAWNLLADQTGLARVQKITKPRRVKSAARLRDCGGMEGWMAALEKIRGSPGLLGDNNRGWKADFDFVLQESSFTKLMEGGYDHWTSPVARQREKSPHQKMYDGFKIAAQQLTEEQNQ